MNGLRVSWDGDGPLPASGTYWPVRGGWHCVTPNGLYGNLTGHAVTEHEDGTITAAPSILVGTGDRTWHGFLERGVWREA